MNESMPMPFLVESFRIKATRMRRLKELNAPDSIMKLERTMIEKSRQQLLQRGATQKQIALWETLDLTIEDAVGRPWCAASENLAEAMERFLDSDGTYEEILEHAADAKQLREMKEEDGNHA